jgi:hypothetical protein
MCQSKSSRGWEKEEASLPRSWLGKLAIQREALQENLLVLLEVYLRSSAVEPRMMSAGRVRPGRPHPGLLSPIHPSPLKASLMPTSIRKHPVPDPRIEENDRGQILKIEFNFQDLTPCLRVVGGGVLRDWIQFWRVALVVRSSDSGWLD